MTVRDQIAVLRYYLFDYNWTLRCLLSGHEWERSFEQPPDRSDGNYLFNCSRCGEAVYGHESDFDE